jgi:CO/xanthine dehydrogenase Mo-binding subunit
MMEELRFEDGRSIDVSLADVKMPTMPDAPPLETVLVESGEGTSVYNVKSIGESPLLAVAPAIANAIRDATGVRLHTLPMTAERVRAALNAAG